MRDSSDEWAKTAVKAKQRYAGFWEWPNTPVRDRGTVETLQNELDRDGSGFFKEPEASDQDPPDIIARTDAGGLVGIELTELVCSQAIQANVKSRKAAEKAGRTFGMRDAYVAEWTPELVVVELHRRMAKKDAKSFLGGPYERRVLLIHTDEMYVIYDQMVKALRGQTFEVTQFTDAFLLFSYRHPDPGTIEGRYPYIRLNLK